MWTLAVLSFILLYLFIAFLFSIYFSKHPHCFIFKEYYHSGEFYYEKNDPITCIVYGMIWIIVLIIGILGCLLNIWCDFLRNLREE